jgi:hypothetical protein
MRTLRTTAQRQLLRLWHFPSTQTPCTWLVVERGQELVVQRLLEPYHADDTDGSSSAAEATLPQAQYATIVAELQRVSLCPSFESEMILDASMYGVEIARYPEPVVLTWTGQAPFGWEALDAWHTRTRHRLNRLLPRTPGLSYEYQVGSPLSFED